MIPVLHITDTVYLPTWILILSLNMCLVLVWVNLRAARWGISRSQALDLTLYMMIGAVVGGRLLHVLFEAPAYYVRQPFAVFFIWQGGFVFYGGLLGALGVAYRWCLRHDQNVWRWGDFFAPMMAVSYAVGRMGCFLNGCCYGRICDLPWGVRFDSHLQLGMAVVARHPTQLYALLWELLVLAYLVGKEKRPHVNGTIFLQWLLLHAIGRIIMEIFRDDDRGPLIIGFTLGTWLSFTLIAVSLWNLRRIKNTVSN